MINSIALARRFRPKNFQSVVGQAVTLQALSNALASKRLHHAYLFTGMRGIGKTSLARILAKCLNCESGITKEPCGSCSSCKEIDEGCSIDVLEIDAASRTRVEDTRELLENVQYLPSKSRFKIYLIDEVHMLSTHSFNALLKTLEEPPAHVKFILATTDPQKLPVTILSRCLQFHLHPFSFSQIVDHLAEVLKQEKIDFEREALAEIARASEGAMRDALSLLEQAIAYGKDKIITQDVQKMLGLADRALLLGLIQALANQDANRMLQICQSLAEKTLDFSALLSELLLFFRHISIAQTGHQNLEENVPHRNNILEFASLLSPEEIQLFYQIGVLGQRDLPYAPTPRIGFEMVLLRMMAFQPLSTSQESSAETEYSEPNIQVQASPKQTKNQVSVTVPAQIQKPLQAPTQTQAQTTNAPTVPNNKAVQHNQASQTTNKKKICTNEDWPEIVQELNLVGITKELAQHCSLVEMQEDFIHLALEEAQKPLLQKRHEEKLTAELSAYFGRGIRLKITTGQASIQANTPAKQQKLAQLASEQEVQKLLEEDSKLTDLIQTFDANIEEIVVDS